MEASGKEVSDKEAFGKVGIGGATRTPLQLFCLAEGLLATGPLAEGLHANLVSRLRITQWT